MSIFSNIFGAAPVAAPAVAPAAPVVPTPGNIPVEAGPASAAVATPGTAPNGTVPVNDATKEGAAKSGLDAFADIWNTEAKPNEQGQPLFNVSHEKMMEAARKQSFTNSAATKEQIEAIAKGGHEAVQAMLEVMNTMSQNVYAQSAYATTRLIEGAFDKSQFAKSSDIANQVKNITLNNTLQQENPIFSHPAAQPMLDGVKNQLLVKYPNATPNELANLAKEYVSSFITAANGPAAAVAATAQAAAKKGEDWGAFFSQ